MKYISQHILANVMLADTKENTRDLFAENLLSHLFLEIILGGNEKIRGDA